MVFKAFLIFLHQTGWRKENSKRAGCPKSQNDAAKVAGGTTEKRSSIRALAWAHGQGWGSPCAAEVSNSCWLSGEKYLP